jgi:hypothetical protein
MATILRWLSSAALIDAGSLLRDRKMFFMKLMTFDHVLPNWLKGSQTYMQSNLSRFNASFSQTT